jgi:hypothetical protein
LVLAEESPSEFSRSYLADDIVRWGVRNGLIAKFDVAMIDILTCE